VRERYHGFANPGKGGLAVRAAAPLARFVGFASFDRSGMELWAPWLSSCQLCGFPLRSAQDRAPIIAALLGADGDDEVLRGGSAGVADAVEFAGVDESCSTGIDDHGLAGDGDGERALHHEEELLVRVLMGRMR
jgi:hypothetical protein